MRLRNVVEGFEGTAFIIFALLTPFLRPRRAKWGATDAEVKKKLPGDELMPHPKWGFTHAVTIKAPVVEVWPWIVQIGQGRGGFYSYELLENLVGCDIHNADRIIPEFQSLKVGDAVKLHPKAPVPVAIVEPNHALVLHYEAAFSSNWMWVLEKVDEKTTRLISRWCGDYGPGLKNRLSFGPFFMEPIEFNMSRKMLLGIKQRVESLARSSVKN